MAVYSSLLWQGSAPSSTAVVYTVPAGITVVVRDVEWLNNTGAALNAYLLSAVSGFGDAAFAVNNSIPVSQAWQWQGRVVIPTGGSISVGGAPSGALVLISGYELGG